MRLKKLELHGFKSFANKTEIVFESGITGIVGPNGCGKSNVVDAIKWVLGTLSYKSVRGDEMMDVICKGAEGVAPMGMAEVTLTLLNDDKQIPLDYEEVTITRRLFSSGESEYLINKSPCRLKDIRELLYGTGIGVDDYSIIEQGKIDKLILSGPRERRQVFDEAAGVSRYKAKKKEAESKLEKVNYDLLRLGDVVREVSRETRSIKIQAGRAARYKEMQEAMKQKQMILIQHQLSELRITKGRLRGEIAEAQTKRDAWNQELQELMTSVSGDSNRLKELDRTLQEAQSGLVTLESQVLSLQDILQRGEVRQGELKAELESCRAELQAVTEKQTAVQADREESGRALDALHEEQAREKQNLEESNRKVAEAIQECAALQDRIEKAKSEIIELMHKGAQYKNEQAGLQSEQNALRNQLTQTQMKKSKFDEEKAVHARQLQECETGVRALEQQLHDLKESKNLEETIGVKLKEKVHEVAENILKLRERKEKVQTRLETMKDLEHQMDGLDAGAKALLHHNGSRYPGILGTVADFIEVDKHHLPVLEACLGEKAGYLVAEDLEKARDAVNYVKSNRLGRVAVIVADLGASEPHAGTNGFPTPLEYIHGNPRYRSVLERLLGHIAVADDLDQAWTWINDGHSHGPVVTRHGDILYPGGILVSAPQDGAEASHGILSRRTEIRDLMMESDVAAAELDRGLGQKTELERMSQVSEEKLDVIRKSIYEKYTLLLEKNSECEQFRKRIQFLNEEEKIFTIEIGQLDGRIAELDRKSASLSNVLAELDGLRQKLEGEIAGQSETLKKYELERSRLDEENASLNVAVARAAEKESALQDRMRVLDADLEEGRVRREKAEEQVRQIEGRSQALGQEMSGKREEYQKVDKERERVKTELDSLKIERDGCAEELGRLHARQQEMMTSLKECEESMQMLKLQESQAVMKLENIVDRANREYELQIDPEGPAAPAPEGVDGEALEKEVEEIRAKMQSMGPVNLLALDRLNELEERFKFLSAQGEDLERSKKQLEELIQKINRESKDLFEKTLAKVREDFNNIFRKLFGGGRADIILEEGEGARPVRSSMVSGVSQENAGSSRDVLETSNGVNEFEAGLEIMAKLPQKEMVALSLLSGGEKSITALALVMALFKANPSPFCLLDEADAALDEKNVGKYTGLIHEFVENTQFVVITHNKRTMAMADILYGVTMERPGVSKVVTVNLTKANAMAEPSAVKQEATAEAAPAAAGA